MIDLLSATVIRNEVNKKIGINSITLEDALRMQPISQSSMSDGYTILALQKHNITILVWIHVSEQTGIVVRGVKTRAW